MTRRRAPEPETRGHLCHAIEGVFEQRRAAAEGTEGDWYVCIHTPTQWQLWER